MLNRLKRLAACLPASTREALQKSWHTWRYRRGTFVHDEPEFSRLSEWVAAGDWVLDVGANVGIFSARLSQLVGATGRVVAFEPVPATFRILVHNTRLFPFANVTPLNIAISAEPTVASMHIPTTAAGLPALARASLNATPEHSDRAPVQVVCLSLANLLLPHRVSFIKIDVEGHEAQVLAGLEGLLRRDRPRLLIEGQDESIHQTLQALGYQREVMPGSPNSIFSQTVEGKSR